VLSLPKCSDGMRFKPTVLKHRETLLAYSADTCAVRRCMACFFEMHPGGVEPSPQSYREPPDSIREHHIDAPRSQRRPSASRPGALASPLRPASQDHPTVPGRPVAAAVSFPDQPRGSRQTRAAHSICRPYGDNLRTGYPLEMTRWFSQIFGSTHRSTNVFDVTAKPG
jgi:hypothetical protein